MEAAPKADHSDFTSGAEARHRVRQLTSRASSDPPHIDALRLRLVELGRHARPQRASHWGCCIGVGSHRAGRRRSRSEVEPNGQAGDGVADGSFSEVQTSTA